MDLLDEFAELCFADQTVEQHNVDLPTGDLVQSIPAIAALQPYIETGNLGQHRLQAFAIEIVGCDDGDVHGQEGRMI